MQQRRAARARAAKLVTKLPPGDEGWSLGRAEDPSALGSERLNGASLEGMPRDRTGRPGPLERDGRAKGAWSLSPWMVSACRACATRTA